MANLTTHDLWEENRRSKFILEKQLRKLNSQIYALQSRKKDLLYIYSLLQKVKIAKHAERGSVAQTQPPAKASLGENHRNSQLNRDSQAKNPNGDAQGAGGLNTPLKIAGNKRQATCGLKPEEENPFIPPSEKKELFLSSILKKGESNGI